MMQSTRPGRSRAASPMFTLVGLAVAGVGAAVVVYAQSGVRLVINGNPVTTTVRKIDGRTYVPIDDVAKALNMQVVASGGQIVLRPGGGANQVAGKRTGTIGEELFTGKYRFLVNGVQETKQYQMKYANKFIYNKTVEAGAGEKLIVVDCRIKNGTPKKDEFAFAIGDWGGNTALTDADGRSYQPAAYDIFADEDAPLGAHALPGAAVPFAIVFRVPESAKPQDLVYTIVRYEERADNKGTDLRISLQQK